jgi:hypothetical protein
LSRSLAEAASRGVRYDKYFAVGKFSRHIFNWRPLSAVRAENNFASLQLFSCISPAMVFYYSATSFGRRLRVARSCPVAASYLMVLLSSTCLLSSPNALKVF